MSGAVAALLICVAGGIGAALRLILDGLIKARIRSSYPVGTTVINVTGSFLLGLLTGLAMSQAMPQQWQLVAGTGLLAATPPSAPPASRPFVLSRIAVMSLQPAMGSACSSQVPPPRPSALPRRFLIIR